MQDVVSGRTSACGGCGLELYVEAGTPAPQLHASPECWALYGEVTATAMNDPALAGLHQLTVDTYAAQHSGPQVPAITTVFALIGLYLALEEGASGLYVRTAHKRLADRRPSWPRFPTPTVERWAMTVFDIAIADSTEARHEAVSSWARVVWQAWCEHHAAVAAMAADAGRAS